jgi:predicted Ser/Thr protein kinase
LKKAAKAENIETVLKENGYSEKAVKEILKWYRGSN